MRRALLAVPLALAGCAMPAVGPPPLAHQSCSSEADCRDAVAEGYRWWDACKGTEDCTDARLYRTDAEHRQEAFRQQTYGAQVVRDRARSEAAAAEMQRAAAAREEARRAWSNAAQAACEASLTEDPCATPSDDVSGADRDSCRSNCRANTRAVVNTAYAASLDACWRALSAANLRGPSACDFSSTGAAQPKLAERADECARDCRRQAESDIANYEQSRIDTLAADRRSRRHATPGTGMLRCNDGTLSPTCGCGRASNQGCCSHHGGVDQCSSDE